MLPSRAPFRRAVVLAGGAQPRRAELDAAWPDWDRSVDLVIGADAGALLAEPLGLQLDLIVGDGDSLGPGQLAAFERAGVPIDRFPPDKDASDLELALLAAVERGATDLVVLGAFGGRLDHILANIWILAHPGLRGCRVSVLDGSTRVRLAQALVGASTPTRLDLADRPAGLVTLLPFDGPAVGLSTNGLRWPLTGATLPGGSSLGLSNEVLGGGAWVDLAGGRLLVIETTLLGSKA